MMTTGKGIGNRTSNARLTEEDIQELLELRQAVYVDQGVPEEVRERYRENDRAFLLGGELGAILGLGFVQSTGHDQHGLGDVVAEIVGLWPPCCTDLGLKEELEPYARRGFVQGFLGAVDFAHPGGAENGVDD